MKFIPNVLREWALCTHTQTHSRLHSFSMTHGTKYWIIRKYCVAVTVWLMPLAALENHECIFPNWVPLLESSLNTFNKTKNPAAVQRLTLQSQLHCHIFRMLFHVYTVLNTTVRMRMRTFGGPWYPNPNTFTKHDIIWPWQSLHHTCNCYVSFLIVSLWLDLSLLNCA